MGDYMAILILKKTLSRVAETVFALLVGLILSAVIIVIHGYSVIDTYYWLFYGGFIYYNAILDALAFATPLMLTGTAFAVASLAGLFNIGVEGQTYMGAIGAIFAGALLVTKVNALKPIALPLALLFSMLLGALWALGPAILKVYFGVHEVISTIMFNWMSFYISMYLVSTGPLVDPNRPEKSLTVVEEARFSVIYSILTTSIYLAVIIVSLTYFLLWHTKLGFEIRTCGINPDAARYAGINVKKTMLLAFIISGALAGLAGGLIVTGRPPKWAIHGTLGDVVNIGFDGIGVALIGSNQPLAIIFSSILIGGLRNGSRLLEPYVKMSSELSRAIIGLIILVIALPELYRYISKHLRGRLT
jgi:simple sugar transport system permease protein